MAPTSSSRRALTITLHWALFLMLLAMIKGGTAAEPLRWAFVAGGGLWVGMAVLRGLLGRPGPKLTGLARSSFAPMHWAMYALLAAAVVLNATALLALTPQVWAWNSLLVLLVAATFHAIFHLWRHTALNDGALRMMTPKAMHKHL